MNCMMILFICFILYITSASAQVDVLRKYVEEVDSVFEYSPMDSNTLHGEDYTGYVYNVTSLSWKDAIPNNWVHTMVICIPHNLEVFDTASLWITGGDRSHIPTLLSADVIVASQVAVKTKMIVAAFFGVPNFPLVFANDPEHRRMGENDVIFYSWRNFMDQYTAGKPDPTHCSFFPAAKASARAMDVIQAVAPSLNNKLKINNFYAFGSSKRGWATWLLAAADRRIKAIAPIVMDNFDTIEMLERMWQAYGNYTYVIESVITYNITSEIQGEAMAALSQVMDIKYYTDVLTMPKLIIDATGDEFFMLDDDTTWWGTLPGDTYRLIVPNTDHTMLNKVEDNVESVSAFFNTILNNQTRPEVSWTIDSITGDMKLSSSFHMAPTTCKVWRTTTIWKHHRDFRFARSNELPWKECKTIEMNALGPGCFQPIFWKSTDLVPVSQKNETNNNIDMIYTVTADNPKLPGYYNAFLIELTYQLDSNNLFSISSQASITPVNNMPNDPCYMEECRGSIV